MYIVHGDEEGRKKEASKAIQTKAKQHSTPKAVTFPKTNELPRVGLNILHVHVHVIVHVHTYCTCIFSSAQIHNFIVLYTCTVPGWCHGYIWRFDCVCHHKMSHSSISQYSILTTWWTTEERERGEREEQSSSSLIPRLSLFAVIWPLNSHIFWVFVRAQG